jgi:monoamine oxidase
VTFDVAIVGGGAAGLAAARALGRAGRSVILLEAQEQAGGRIKSVLDPRSPVPIELGPEFIHGQPTVTLALLRELGMTAVGEGGTSFEVDGALRLTERRDGAFERAAEALRRGKGAKPGETVADLLARDTSAQGQKDAALVARLVGGFDAADPARASLREIAQEWAGDAMASQARPSGGYAPLVAHLVRSLDEERVRLRFGATVTSLAWSMRGVEVGAVVRGATRTFRARHAIVTVPIGVLQLPAGSRAAIAFDPPLPAATVDAIAGIVMGPVVKVVMRFRSSFWERVQEGRLRDAAFFMTESAFPTYWTQVPQRAPLLTAWAGGPAAHALRDLEREATLALALAGAGNLFGDPSLVDDECEAAYLHDWQRDPFSCGAYSYVLAGGEDARAQLRTPLADCLYFAGEATADGGEGGTVAGALQSGQRAASILCARTL